MRITAAERALTVGEFRLAADEYRKAALASDDVATVRAATEVNFEFARNTRTLALLDHWQTLAPADPLPAQLRGRVAMRTGDVAAAVSAFSRYLTLSVPPATLADDSFDELANILGSDGSAASALSVAEGLLAERDDDWRAHRLLSKVALRADELIRSQEGAERAYELAPDSFAAGLTQAEAIILGGDRSAGLEFAAEIAKGRDGAEDRLDYARLLSSNDELDEAAALVDAVLADEPTYGDAVQARAILDVREGELELAWERFSQLVASPQHRQDALFFLANIAEQQGRFAQARRIYAQIGEGPNAVVAQQRVSSLLLRSGDAAAALEHLERYSRRHPEQGFRLQLARAALHRELGQTDKALALYDTLLDVRPEAEGLKLTRAETLLADGQLDAAISDYRKSLREHPDSALSLNALGYTLADRTDRFDEAHELIARALALDPNNPAIIDSMGWVEFKLGRLEEARGYLERAWELIKDPEVAAHLGETLWQLGERDRARAILKEAYDRNPDSVPLRRTLERLLEQDARVES